MCVHLPDDALDLGSGELGELHAPLHGAAGLPLLLVAARPSEVRVARLLAVGGQGGDGAERAPPVRAAARGGGRDGGEEAGRPEEEEERAAQVYYGGCGGGVRHGLRLTDS